MLITPPIHTSRILKYLYFSLFHKSQALPFLHGRLSVPLCSVPCGCWSLSSRQHTPQMRTASTCICLFSLSYITITPVLPIPSWRRKLETEFLKYLAVRVLATPPTAQLITFLTMSFSYYHIGDITCVSPCCNTWRHIVVVIHFSELEITYTPFTFAVKFQWRFFSECNFHVLIHRQGV